MTLPDVQANEPDVHINLTRVGVTEVKKLVEVARSGKRPIVLVSTFDIFVDLPSTRKGANLSRNFEAIDEVIEEALASPIYEIEELCSEISRRLLSLHEYATRAETRMESEYIVTHKTPVSGKECQEMVDISAKAVATNVDGEIIVKKTVGAEVTGMTACPCAQQIMRERAVDAFHDLDVDDDIMEEFLERVPMATHNQRGRGEIVIEVHDGYEVSLDDIIDIIEASMSSEIHELLKRGDEAAVVDRAHRNPKFVEDAVRTMAQKIVEFFTDLPDTSVVTIKQTNEESIHRHNAFAERKATLGELRAEVLAEDAEDAEDNES